MAARAKAIKAESDALSIERCKTIVSIVPTLILRKRWAESGTQHYMDHVEARVPPSRTSTTSSNRWAEAEGRMRTMGRPDAGNSARAAAEAAAAARQALRNSANGQASAPEASNSLAQRDGRNGFTAAESHKRAHSGRNDDYDLCVGIHD